MLNLTMTTQEIELMNRIDQMPAEERAQQLVNLWMLANRRQSVLNQIDWLDDQAEVMRIGCAIDERKPIDPNDLLFFAGRAHPHLVCSDIGARLSEEDCSVELAKMASLIRNERTAQPA